MQRGLRPRGTHAYLAMAIRAMWPSARLDSVGVPKSVAFRGSIPGPHVPLPTLRPCPYGQRRTARGQSGSLLWSCLSFVDTFKLWGEGVYDAEESSALPAGAAA